MKEFWDKRYKEKEYAYGTEPNEFFKESLPHNFAQGKILLPAEGEGRNAVYAAGLGYDVTAFDFSSEAQKKALKLAESNQVTLNYLVGTPRDLTFPENSFDVIGLIFAHFGPDHKDSFFGSVSRYLKKGGTLIFEAFSKEQLDYNSKNPHAGGPRDEELLFSKEEVKNYFRDLETILLEKSVLVFNEGKYHLGEGSVIRYIGRKA